MFFENKFAEIKEHLYKYQGLSLENALKLVKKKIPNPNKGFLEQVVKNDLFLLVLSEEKINYCPFPR